ncbi:hypothetical protein BCR42DRAFT_491104 [Absidia repens]|uniref:BZIP domain-containing protein n=1 Tax=Absidia repens TaxID=90262 RepID=A0A1X2IIL8_9FUNG|nr:hypothetical protein BCR42DRAFT_491104 [Absidia repens]
MNDSDMDMDMEFELGPDETHSIDQQEQQSHDTPIRMRKKPGRKPNPASPALRKAQNRAAQRAFRERKERHMRELEIAIKQIREQRDKLYLENEQLRTDAEINRSENWYLKGIVLTLQLVCYQHNIAIPKHGPFINEQTLSVMAQSTPEPIAAYLTVNANNKLPPASRLSGYRHSVKRGDRYLSSGSILVTKDDVCQQQFPALQPMKHPLERYRQPSSSASSSSSTPPPSSSFESECSSSSSPSPSMDSGSLSPPYQQQYGRASPEKCGANEPSAMPALSPILDQTQKSTPSIPRPPQNEPIASNLAAIQTLRMRLRLQSACARMDSVPFSIQPSILQLTIPHDPRIDLIPTPHMRDRMILFRDQFDLDDCFKCLLSASVFHGGDPAAAENWQLPKVFFEKFWFLTIDYTLRRTTNRWRRLQGLNELENDLATMGNDSHMAVDPQASGTQNSDIDKTYENDVERIKQKQRQQEEVATTKSGANKSSTAHTCTTDLTGLSGLPALEQQHLPSQQHYPQTRMSPSPWAASTDTGLSFADLSSYLGVEFSKIQQIQQKQQQQQQKNDGVLKQTALDSLYQLNDAPENTFEPVRLTNGYLLPQSSPKHTTPTVTTTATNTMPHNTAAVSSQQDKVSPVVLQSQHKVPSTQQQMQDPWNALLLDSSNPSRYDALVNNNFRQPDHPHPHHDTL